MNNCDRPRIIQYQSLQWGTPNPRYIRPLVRIDGLTQDMPLGAKFDPCFLPPTLLRFDPCAKTLQVNDAMVSLAELVPCPKLPMGAGAPTGTLGDGYLPLYIDTTTNESYYYDSNGWTKIN